MMNVRAIFACVIAWWPACAAALDASLDVSQYAHTAWRIREGFTKSVIVAMAQTPDGYLWLGTESGLVRFDGVRAVPWSSRYGESLPDEHVRVLLVARDGTLWIGTMAGLASLAHGKLTNHPAFVRKIVNSLAQDREGAIWVSARGLDGATTLCTIRARDDECREAAGPDPPAAEIYVDARGRVWAVGEAGISRVSPAPVTRFPLRAPLIGGLTMVAEDADGALLVTTRAGIRRIVDGRDEPYRVDSLAPGTRATLLFRDRDGALWVNAEAGGLLHVHRGRVDRFARGDGLSADHVEHVFEDREGNVWVSTAEGLDRFRRYAVTTISVGQGLSDAIATSVVASRGGAVWVATKHGVDRWANGAAAPVRVPSRGGSSLFEDRSGRLWVAGMGGAGYVDAGRFVPLPGVPEGVVESIVEDRRGDIWIPYRGAGLLRWSADRGLERASWSAIGLRGIGHSIAVDPSGEGLWLGSFDGIAHLEGGRVRATFSAQDGLGPGRVRSLRFDGRGDLWASTDGGLSRLHDGRIATVGTANGLPCAGVDWMVEDDMGSAWLFADCGLLRIARADLEAWAAAADRGQGAGHALHVSLMDASDGVVGSSSLGAFGPHVSKAPDGRLWFVTRVGLAVFDPHHLRRNELPPPVQIEELLVDHEPFHDEPDATGALHLPPFVHELQVDYTALSFVAPEKMRFRYRLEGYDRAWRDVGTRRQAFYSNLAPGNYRFQVIASNDSGVWNEKGAFLDFSIAPAWWQTVWFRVACAAGILLLLYEAYQLRLRQVRREFNLTLDARVSERMRIARDLHDTLLQSFHGLLLKFQTASSLLPARPAEAKQALDSAIDQAADAVTEGRDAVQGLRVSATEMNDLANALRTLGETLAAEYGNGNPPGLRVEVQGASRPLHPILRDEIFRIAGEALRNAFRHAHARQVEVEICYDPRELRLRVRDDGRGIDAAVLAQGGRTGHFGLSGMRERAQAIGGRLAVWSAPGAGTEVELRVPAAHAYAVHTSASRPPDKVHEEP